MSGFWRTSAVTGVGIFLEACAFYLVIAIVSALLGETDAALSFWLVFTALLSAFLLSGYVQSLPFSRGLRGAAGLTASVLSLLVLSQLNSGLGPTSWGNVVGGDVDTAVALFMGLVFLVLLWWRGVTMAQDEVNLDTVRASFQWGLIVLLIAVMLGSLYSTIVVSGYLAVGFIGVGLAGLSMARFTWEAKDSQGMPAAWWIPIGASVGGVIVLALLISAAGIGGLDDITRTVLKTAGNVGFLLLSPVILGVGYLAGLLVGLANLVSGWFGGGDLTELESIEAEMREFHAQMREEAGDKGPPALLVIFLKGASFAAAATFTGWLVYRIFRFQRLRSQGGDGLETRESTFSWSRANRDLSALLAEWWSSLPVVGAKRSKGIADPSNPREFYHGLLALTAKMGNPRLEWQTPKEHQHTLVGLLPREPVGRIVDAFQISHYGQVAANDRELVRLGQDWSALNEFLEEREREG
ncbi:MAG: DUF4129 domain-containing protein [Dehalococcoidia bacterium]|jgi:hypothetical protein|nr:DUF4129 domain-containing protein [Dehalococcoidia bacterium]MDP7199864.1 DUF4129 domain-containing protein [Dehalococcoidia bacterium]